MRKPYHLQPATKTQCPRCEHRMVLMMTDALRMPAFYICFVCEDVYQIGVGLVERDPE